LDEVQVEQTQGVLMALVAPAMPEAVTYPTGNLTNAHATLMVGTQIQ
jgi:hypothetical protein